MDTSSLLRKPAAWLPIAVSLGAIAVVLTHVAIYGLVRDEHEGLAATIYQLLMVAQAPIVIYFLLTWMRRAPRQSLLVLGMQIGAALVAVGVAYWAKLA